MQLEFKFKAKSLELACPNLKGDKIVYLFLLQRIDSLRMQNQGREEGSILS